MSHDFAAQKRETFDSFTEMKKAGAELPATSVVEFYLLAEDENAKWGPCEKALQAAGFLTARDEDGETLIVTTRKELRITAESVWAEEEKVSTIAVKFDFTPDGWEFGFDEDE